MTAPTTPGSKPVVHFRGRGGCSLTLRRDVATTGIALRVPALGSLVVTIGIAQPAHL